MSRIKLRFSLNSRWLTLFGFWMLFLTGVFANALGTPGILQSVRLNNLHRIKQTSLSRLQEGLHQLQTEVADLETNRFAQQREIRRVLGYAAPDEIIFDFSTN